MCAVEDCLSGQTLSGHGITDKTIIGQPWTPLKSLPDTVEIRSLYMTEWSVKMQRHFLLTLKKGSINTHTSVNVF